MIRRRAWTPIGVVTVRFIAELRGPSPALIHPTSTLASSAEIDERYVQKQRGHASAKMTRRYQRRHERFRDSPENVAPDYAEPDSERNG